MPASPLARPQRDISAILFADVHGYARLMDRNEERTYERVARAIRLIKSLIGDYGGRVMNVAGDGVLALFESAPQALKFAVTIQQEFRNEAVWNADDEPVAFRIGINVGEVLVDEEANVQGHSINIAARIQALAQPGGICVSEAVRRAVQDTLGVSIRSLGPQSLKNIAQPIEIFAIEINGPQPAYSAEPFLREQPPLGAPLETSVAPDEASVVVLPLDNMSGDLGSIHLCDGITRDIIANLSRFRDLLVIAPHSAFLFKQLGLPLQEMRRQLGVRYLFTGGLERSDSRVRIRAQLTEIESERVIWSERFDGDLGELFAFQDEVTAVIAARLAIHVSGAERRRALSAQTPDLRAYGLILRGQHLSIQFKKEANLHARRLFEHAAEIDPGYGRSYAGLSRTFNIAWRYEWTQSRELCLNKSIELAREAIKRDEFDARGYSELGFAYLYSKRHDDSLAAYGRAIELNPNDADILAEMGGAVSFSGDPNAALDLLKRAVRLNPYHPDWYLWFLGEAQFDLGHYEDAIGTLQRMLDQSEGHRLLAASYALSGRLEEAKYHAQQVMSVYPDFTIEHWRTVPPDRNPEPLERFLEGLRKAGLK
jgi:adenylate cyclase